MPSRFFRRIVTVLAAALLSAACTQGAAGPTLTAEEALAKAESGEITLVDIRTPEEWRQTGVAPVAQRINMLDPAGPSAFLAKLNQAVDGDKTAPIAVICRTGNRSAALQQQLTAIGFTHVYNVSEGMAGGKNGAGWIPRGLPIKPCPNC